MPKRWFDPAAPLSGCWTIAIWSRPPKPLEKDHDMADRALQKNSQKREI